MISKILLDIQGLIPPLALLKCKSCLKTMERGSVLEVLLMDIDVARDLIMIVERSNDEIIYEKKKENHTCLGIRKG